jgi:hypothetical protein
MEAEPLKSLYPIMFSLTGLGHGDSLGAFTGLGMRTKIPTVRTISRFTRFVDGEAAFCISDQLVNLNA